MTIHQASQQLISQLHLWYDEREAKNITDLVMENLTHYKKIDRLLNKEMVLSSAQLDLFTSYTEQLVQQKPVQYVLNEAWFCGMKFQVNENTLIPRPETEELVHWIIADCKLPIADLKMLDVGTGSGCIAIALKKKLPEAEISACDISEQALKVAETNAAINDVNIKLVCCDFLNKEERNSLHAFDIIVSNPPYIPANEKSTIPLHVLKYEPHLALFVNDDDPFQFYHAIAEFSKNKLSPTGSIYVEMHEDLAMPVSALFQKKGFHTTDIRKDMQGKNRMLRARRVSGLGFEV